MINLKVFAVATTIALTIAGASYAEGVEMKDGKPVIHFCTGTKSGNYDFAGKEIARRLQGTFAFIPVRTNGSRDNMEKVRDGQCQWGFTQGDVAEKMLLDDPAIRNEVIKVAKVYREAFHVVCNRSSKVDRITDIPKNGLKVYGAADGSGTAETLRILFGADTKTYSSIERDPTTGIEALRNVKDEIDGAGCYAIMSGVNSDLMVSADMFSVNTPNHKPSLKLINVNDRDMEKLQTYDGKPMYEFLSLNTAGFFSGKGIYKNLLQDDIKVPTTTAYFVMNADWKTANKGLIPRIEQAINDATPTINKKVAPSDQLN